MNAFKDNDDILNRINSYLIDVTDVIEEVINYNGTKTIVRVKCSNCGDIYQKTYRGLYRRQFCKCRRKTSAYSYDFVRNYISEHGCQLLSTEYKNCWQKLDIVCGKKGHKFSTAFTYFKHGKTRCKYCWKEEQIGRPAFYIEPAHVKAHSYEYIRNFVHNRGHVLLSNNYTNNKSILKIKCDKGHEFETKFCSYTNATNGCRQCANEKMSEERRYTIDDIKNYISERGDMLISADYKNVHSVVKIKCGNCGIVFDTKWGNYNRCNSCPHCSMSGGEKIISHYLRSNDIEFESQKTFEDCVDKSLLRFDFYLPDINLCIEYDGMQHYKPVEVFGGIEAFDDRVRKDEIKNNYCKTNNINLERITYKEKDISKKLYDLLFVKYGIDEIINPA